MNKYKVAACIYLDTNQKYVKVRQWHSDKREVVDGHIGNSVVLLLYLSARCRALVRKQKDKEN